MHFSTVIAEPYFSCTAIFLKLFAIGIYHTVYKNLTMLGDTFGSSFIDVTLSYQVFLFLLAISSIKFL